MRQAYTVVWSGRSSLHALVGDDGSGWRTRGYVLRDEGLGGMGTSPSTSARGGPGRGHVGPRRFSEQVCAGCQAPLSLARVNEGRIRCEDCTKAWQVARAAERTTRVEQVAQALRAGAAMSAIARQLGLGYATVRRIAIELQAGGR
jgi:hypothetical protein